MRLYNTLTRKIEDFNPLYPPAVGMYTCGPTVYWSTHIGHMSKYVGDDTLKRVLTYNGYQVKHVMNITDVGHLVSDQDEGEDKMEVGAKREGLSVWDLAKKYEEEFFKTMDALNVLRPDIICRATEHITEQITLIKRLEKKNLTYETNSAVYFDVDKFPQYWSFTGQKLEEKKIGAREDVVLDSQKRHPYDFALWFKRVGRFKNHVMHWNSPWGDGFPGWHIECSAMSLKYLGESFNGERSRTIDIHTGGIDHIGVHHPAEIAQSEGATGKPFVKYWVHRVFIMVDGKKMSKSLGNFYTLEDILERGFTPMALRWWFLTGHYRTAMNFTWQSLRSAQETFNNLSEMVHGWRKSDERMITQEEVDLLEKYKKEFREKLDNDLNTPDALAVVWQAAKSNLPSPDKLDLILDFDQVLGLKLGETTLEKGVPSDVEKLVAERESLRKEKKWKEADRIRGEIEKLGFIVEDAKDGSVLKKK